MKAARFSRFGGPDVLEIVDLPDPHAGPGQVRIAVRAAGVNASDWKKRQGLMDQELPQTVGYEAAGTVDELGEGVTDVAVGDRVFGMSTAGAAPGGTGGAVVLRAHPAVARLRCFESGRFSLPVGHTFPLTDVAGAHRAGEAGHLRGKLVLLVD